MLERAEMNYCRDVGGEACGVTQEKGDPVSSIA